MNRKKIIGTTVSAGIIVTIGVAGFLYQKSTVSDVASPEEIGEVEMDGPGSGPDWKNEAAGEDGGQISPDGSSTAGSGGSNSAPLPGNGGQNNESAADSSVSEGGSSGDSASPGGSTNPDETNVNQGSSAGTGNGGSGGNSSNGSSSSSSGESSGTSGGSPASSSGNGDASGGSPSSSSGNGGSSSDKPAQDSGDSSSNVEFVFGKLPEEAFVIEKDTLFNEWSVILKNDQLPSSFQDAAKYVLTLDGDTYSLEKNQFNENIFNVNVPADTYTQEEIKKGIVKAEK